MRLQVVPAPLVLERSFAPYGSCRVVAGKCSLMMDELGLVERTGAEESQQPWIASGMDRWPWRDLGQAQIVAGLDY